MLHLPPFPTGILVELWQKLRRGQDVGRGCSRLIWFEQNRIHISCLVNGGTQWQALPTSHPQVWNSMSQKETPLSCMSAYIWLDLHSQERHGSVFLRYVFSTDIQMVCWTCFQCVPNGWAIQNQCWSTSADHMPVETVTNPLCTVHSLLLHSASQLSLHLDLTTHAWCLHCFLYCLTMSHTGFYRLLKECIILRNVKLGLHEATSCQLLAKAGPSDLVSQGPQDGQIPTPTPAHHSAPPCLFHLKDRLGIFHDYLHSYNTEMILISYGCLKHAEITDICSFSTKIALLPEQFSKVFLRGMAKGSGWVRLLMLI